MVVTSIHTASVRIPENVYRESEKIARRRKISFNALVQQALQREIEAEQERDRAQVGEKALSLTLGSRRL